MFGWLCKKWLKMRGWTLLGPDVTFPAKAVLIFAPHTSNWDFVTMLSAKFAYGIKVRYLGKHSLFKPPFGWFFRSIGGIPVVRHEKRNVVDQVVDLIRDEDEILLALSPEGTRSFTDYWRSGFYHIADKAQLPIIMFFLDTKSKTIGYSEPFNPTGDLDADMATFRAFYADKVGYRPELTSTIQSKAEYSASLKS